MFSEREQRIRELERSKRAKSAKLKSLELLAKKLSDQTIAMRQFADAQSDAGSGGCSGTVTVFVKCGASTPIPGRTVSITDGTTTLTGTTNSSGIVVFTPGVAGSWTGTASGTGVTSVGFSFTFACSSLSITVTMNGLITLTGSVQGCNFEYLPGALVTITSGATTLGTATTDSGGNYSIPAFEYAGGALTITGTRSRFEAKIQTYTPPCHGNGGLSFTMIPANDYYCDPCGGPIPIYKDLNVTTSKGSFTITYDADTGQWLGTQTVTAYVNTDCTYSPPFGSTNHNCLPDSGTLTLFWSYGSAGLGFGWYACIPAMFGGCFFCPVDDGYRAAHPTHVTTTGTGSFIGCGTTHVNFPFFLSGTDTAYDCGIPSGGTPAGADPVLLAGAITMSE